MSERDVRLYLSDVLDSGLAIQEKVDIVRLRDKMNQALRSRIEQDAIYV